MLLEPDEPPKNLGWSAFEGTHRVKGHELDEAGELVWPVAQYPHPEGCSVTGGVVYAGRRWRRSGAATSTATSARAPVDARGHARRARDRRPPRAGQGPGPHPHRDHQRRRAAVRLGQRRALPRAARRLLIRLGPRRARSPARRADTHAVARVPGGKPEPAAAQAQARAQLEVHELVVPVEGALEHDGLGRVAARRRRGRSRPTRAGSRPGPRPRARVPAEKRPSSQRTVPPRPCRAARRPRRGTPPPSASSAGRRPPPASRLDHAPVAQDGDLVGQRERLGLVVGDEQGARARGAQDPGDLLAQRLAKARVERGERLVEQDHLGVGRERAGERDPLALAARELVRVGLGAARGRRARASRRRARGARRRSRRWPPRRGGEQGALLEDHADPAAARLDPTRRRSATRRPPIRTRPASGRSKPAIIRSSVVLPEPLGRAAPLARRGGRAGWRRRPPRWRRTSGRQVLGFDGAQGIAHCGQS